MSSQYLACGAGIVKKSRKVCRIYSPEDGKEASTAFAKMAKITLVKRRAPEISPFWRNSGGSLVGALL